jgi:nicotinate phosphoribosyltransferase
MATNDLDEHSIAALTKAGAPIDVFGVGTSLATSFDAPALSCVYKLVELETPQGKRYPFKKSTGKATLPAQKQIFRFPDHDFVALATESCPVGAQPLLTQVMQQGQPLVLEKNIRRIQSYAREQISRFGRPGRSIVYSEQLRSLAPL